MKGSLSANTQAILLLTAPLIAGRSEPSPGVLAPGEYKRLARFLRDGGRQPSDLLGPGAEELLMDCQRLVDTERLRRILARGFLLSQAVEHWQARAIWVLSRADAEYPKRLKERLREDAPAVLYGCGDASILDSGGLAVVGSRHVDETLVEYTQGVGRLTARSGRTLVSGGARGIDQAAMTGALGAGGKVSGVLSDSLERMALRRENRLPLMNGQLVLVSPYDPAAGFNVGNAMQRNKLIYALADAALVVSSDFEKGGTWAGAIEQLGKLRYVPVYVRSGGQPSRGLDGLRRKGAFRWPDPGTSETFVEVLRIGVSRHEHGAGQMELPVEPDVRHAGAGSVSMNLPPSGPDLVTVPLTSPTSPDEELEAKVTKLLAGVEAGKSEAEVAGNLGVPLGQARKLLRRLVDGGVLERLPRPVRYRHAASQTSLFGGRDHAI